MRLPNARASAAGARLAGAPQTQDRTDNSQGHESTILQRPSAASASWGARFPHRCWPSAARRLVARGVAGGQASGGSPRGQPGSGDHIATAHKRMTLLGENRRGVRAAQRTALELRARHSLAHRVVDCFIGSSLARKRNAVAAPASSKRQLGVSATDLKLQRAADQLHNGWGIAPYEVRGHVYGVYAVSVEESVTLGVSFIPRQ
jgi:hypothetical protein